MKDEIFDEISQRLGNYKCEGQISLFDVTGDEQYINEPQELPVENIDIDIVGQMSIFDFLK